MKFKLRKQLDIYGFGYKEVFFKVKVNFKESLNIFKKE
jgi:hypothetical protein